VPSCLLGQRTFFKFRWFRGWLLLFWYSETSFFSLLEGVLQLLLDGLDRLCGMGSRLGRFLVRDGRFCLGGSRQT
jgi:hypothetical protein